MPEIVDIVMPVRWQTRSANGSKTLGCYVDARMRSVRGDEAPVVARWNSDDYETMDFRAADGRLWERELGFRSALSLEDLMPKNVEHWRMAKVGEEDWHARTRYHFPRAGVAFFGGLTEFVDDPTPYPDLVEAIAIAKSEVEGCLLIDGEVWRESVGPSLTIEYVSKAPLRTAELRLGEPRTRSGTPITIRALGARTMLNGFDVDGVALALNHEFRSVDRKGGELQVLSDAGWTRGDLVSRNDQAIVESLLTSMSDYSRRLPKRIVGDEMLAAIVAVRESWEAKDLQTRTEACRGFVDELVKMEGVLDIFGPSKVFEFKAWSAIVASLEARQMAVAPELKGFSA